MNFNISFTNLNTMIVYMYKSKESDVITSLTKKFEEKGGTYFSSAMPHSRKFSLQIN